MGDCCTPGMPDVAREVVAGTQEVGPCDCGGCGAGGENPARAATAIDECCGVEKEVRDFEADPLGPWWKDRALLPSVISGVFLLVGYILAWSGVALAPVVFQGVALVAGAWTFVPGAIRALWKGRVGVALLMTIAAVGAVALGHVGEAGALAFLFSLAETLEDRAMDRAQVGLRALLALIPDTARVSRDSVEQTILAKELEVGDLLIVGAGQRVATDGTVEDGQSALDTSAATGESIPVDVSPGATVAAGSINVGGGSLRVRASAAGTDNSLTQIVTLVEQAQAKKGVRARLADRIARPLVPLVLIAAVLVAVFGFIVGDPLTWIERALVVLVAASPCALAIAVPVTVISAIGAASKFGVVIKSGEAFEQLGAIRTIAFDKTGTLTRNQPSVVDMRTFGGFDPAEVIELAAAAESTSTHPLATAIVQAATRHPIPEAIEEVTGSGIIAGVRGQRVEVGNAKWLPLGGHSTQAAEMAELGMTVVAVRIDGVIAGLVGIRDELRPEASEAIADLRASGVDPVILTGDNRYTAAALARELGVEEVQAEQLPQDKAEAVAELVTQAPTAMVGDGINDAPALASATVGIAMGLTGSAAAIESADVAFTGTDLRLIPAALEQAKRGRRIMTLNIGLALAIIIALFPLALFGVLGLAGVVLVHEAAEVIVILNGTRAARRPIVLSTHT